MGNGTQIESSTKIEVSAGPVYCAAIILAAAIIMHGCMTSPVQRQKVRDVRVKMMAPNEYFNNY